MSKWVDASRRSAPDGEVGLPEPFLADESLPQDYILDDALEAAANAAIRLGQPLLLTGAPGTGKTRFAHHLAWQLGRARPLEFNTKSTSIATDLFYTYDGVRRLRLAPSADVNEWDFVRFNALGSAILRALGRKERASFFPRGLPKGMDGEPARSVVLVDEIDKAPRDFPNDLLQEIPSMSFNVAELGVAVQAPKEQRPIVVITSNTERPLPDAFLRRCVFHHIEPPTEDQLRRILTVRFDGRNGAPTLTADQASYASGTATEVQSALSRSPTTSEFIGWVGALFGGEPFNDDSERDARASQLAPILAKNEEDLRTARLLLAKSR